MAAATLESTPPLIATTTRVPGATSCQVSRIMGERYRRGDIGAERRGSSRSRDGGLERDAGWRRDRAGGGPGYLVPLDLAVQEDHLAARMGRDVGLVGHEDDRVAVRLELVEHAHDLGARLGIQVPGRLVG